MNKIIEEELLNIQRYIEKNYQLKTEIKEKKIICDNLKFLYIYTEKYDLIIRVADKTEENYLIDQYGISFWYEANKKYRSELSYCGGGRLEKYAFREYKIIDDFLEKFEVAKKENQTTIFDFIEEEY